VKPEKARAVESMILQMAQRRQITAKVCSVLVGGVRGASTCSLAKTGWKWGWQGLPPLVLLAMVLRSGSGCPEVLPATPV